MKVSRALVAEHRQDLLEQGGRLFRRHGIGGVSVADVAGAAGLTHGAFYGRFASKATLATEAVGSSLMAGALAPAGRAGAGAWGGPAGRAGDEISEPGGPRCARERLRAGGAGAGGGACRWSDGPGAARRNRGAGRGAGRRDGPAASGIGPVGGDRAGGGHAGGDDRGLVLARALGADTAASDRALQTTAALVMAAADLSCDSD